MSPLIYAHDNVPQRRVIVSVSYDSETQNPKLQTLILTQLSPHPRLTFLLSQYDLNRDGHLQSPEALALAGTLSPQLMRGLHLSFGSTLLSPSHAEARAQVSSDGAVTLAVLLDYTHTPPKTEKYRVALLAPSVNPSQPSQSSVPYQWPVAELQLQAPYTLVTSSHPPARDALVLGPVALVPGTQGLWMEFTITPPAKP